MGEGGNLVLVNGTKYTWSTTENDSYQMNSWPFPVTVNAGQTASLYVEWNQRIFKTQSDDAGNATLSLQGTSGAFQLQARNTSQFDLLAALTSLSTQNNPQASVIDLGWRHNIPPNTNVPFILAGQEGDYWSNHPPVAWMQAALPAFGGRTLGQFCMPGSHDAGMSTITSGRFLGGTIGQGDVITQTNSIGGQLQLGSRFFDIRPVVAGGQFATGHYTGKVGANGELLASIIAEINAFTANNAELIILDLSHDMDTDSGASPWPSLNQDQWNRLFGQLTGPGGLNALYAAPAGVTDLTTLTLNDFIGSGKAAVVIIVETPGVDLSQFAGKGIYPASALNANNNYSDTDDAATMESGQLNNLRTYQRAPGNDFFVLSWTVTQTTGDAITGALGLGAPVIYLADNANYDIYPMLLPVCSASIYPNVLLIDDILSSNIAALAMAVNFKALFG
jgi:hypothetical protein